MTEIYRLHYAPDNASLIIRLALEELGVPYTCVLVDRAGAAHKSPAYLALNPNGLIPVLETPEGVLFETGAILLWLADRHCRLAPMVESVERGDFLKWLFFLSNTLHPALRMTFYPAQYVGDDPGADLALRGHMQGEIARHLDALESMAASGRAWFCGADPSLLDLYLAPLLRWMVLYPAPMGGAGWFSLSRWPHLRDMAIRLEQRRSVAAAIKAEGLNGAPFTAPEYADPPEGSAT
ncbi:glutathione S-transferase family protein [uncultured Roseovarius sp.]|mgnify:CR=1 FL=1|uniref:glutathione S-transferase family protein n=1 Tax=Roseovarius sp. TaxID=1486281 RepID=UPI0025DB4824|nr:glutathione S-transferase family protein [uncultured Roseovarius sp.]